MTFQKTVLIVAFVVLIICLTILGLMIRSAVKNGEFPPEISFCPDYWKTSYNKNGGLVCLNSLGMPKGKDGGVAPCDTIDLSDSKYQGMGPKAMRSKCEIANACHVTWDGVTNGTDINNKKWC